MFRRWYMVPQHFDGSVSKFHQIFNGFVDHVPILQQFRGVSWSFVVWQPNSLRFPRHTTKLYIASQNMQRFSISHAKLSTSLATTRRFGRAPQFPRNRKRFLQRTQVKNLFQFFRNPCFQSVLERTLERIIHQKEKYLTVYSRRETVHLRHDNCS